ncbi:hypothetical protein [Halobacillus hunanensis]|uniref:hypothetical protein n=1 Tax=Halobacillus hunanensis TaxID=578214 RepID=UPI0009A67F78|nr:hypothetical protein [Halobacillus hunanensis]
MNQNKFTEYLTIRYLAAEIRSMTIIHVLLFTDFMGLYMLFGHSELGFIFNLGLVPVIILNVWSVLYIIAPYRYELSFVLFYGVWGLLTSFVHFLVIQKFLYNIVQFESLGFFYVGLIFYLLSVSSVLVMQHLTLLDNFKIQEGPGTWPKWVAVIPGFSYLFAQFVFTAIQSGDIKSLIFVGALTLVTIYPILAVKLIHQYFFLIKYKEELMVKYPVLGRPKKSRNLENSW